MRPYQPLLAAGLLATTALLSPQTAHSDVSGGSSLQIEVTTLTMMQDPAKAGSANGLKPAPIPRIPGPMLSLHKHLRHDGPAVEYCSEDHARVRLPPMLPVLEQPR